MDASNRASHHDGRILLTLALMALAGASAAALGRVFEGSAPTLRLVLAAGAAVLVGALLERRHVALSLLAAAVGLLAAVGLTVFPETTVYGLPTVETVQALARALGRVGQHATEQRAPAEALPSLFSASLIGAWCAAYASHLLAARAGSAVLALVPPAALLGFTGIVLDGGPHPGYAGVFLGSAIAVLFATALRDLRLWGPVLPPRPRQTVGMAVGPVGRRARLLGVAAILGALLLPGVLPGFGADSVVDFSSGRGRVAISPLVDIRPNLQRRDPVELFTVRTERPSYWRLFVVDRFTGRLWVSTEDEGVPDATVVQGRQNLPRGPMRRGDRALRQEITLTGLGGDHLPAAFVPVAVDVPTAVRYDPARGTLAAPDGLPSGGLEYAVVSEVVAPGPDELDRAFDFSGVPERYLQLPADVPSAVVRLARDLTASAPTPYRKALAIQSYLRSFDYDEQFPAGHGADDLLYFLEQRRGYCEQFSATMAVFLRALGYPARVAIGFTPGVRDRSGAYRVTTEEAHAWTEMFFPGHGWLAFEPTPTRGNPTATTYLDLPAGSPIEVPPAGVDVQEQFPGGRGLDPRLEHLERRLGEGGVEEETAAEEAAERRRGWRVALSLLGLAALLVAAVPAAKAIRRRRLLRRAGDPRRRVLAAFAVFEAGAADLGLGRRPDETLDEYRDRLSATVRISDGRLERLTGLAGRALYSDRQPDEQDAAGALADARAGGVDVRRHVGRARALVGALRPFPPDDPSR